MGMGGLTSVTISDSVANFQPVMSLSCGASQKNMVQSASRDRP